VNTDAIALLFAPISSSGSGFARPLRGMVQAPRNNNHSIDTLPFQKRMIQAVGATQILSDTEWSFK
jgi:hypothetical protein